MPERIRIGDSAHTGAPIRWLNERGYDAEGIGTDGFGQAGREGVAFARDFDDPTEQNQIAWVGQWINWDGTTMTVTNA